MRFSSLLITGMLTGYVVARPGPLIIGDRVKVKISSEVQGQMNDDASETYKYSFGGASYIAVHFSAFDFPPGCSMEISDNDGGQSYDLKGKGNYDLVEFWPRQVNGDTMLLTKTCDEKSKMSQCVFEINEVVHGYPEGDKQVGQKSICGANDKSNAICFKNSHQTIYNKSRAAGRVVMSGRGMCTGWLVSGTNLMLTNEHCIGSDAIAKNSNIEFMREEPQCGVNGSPQGGELFQISRAVTINETWDFALVQIDTSDGRNPAAKYGYLELENRKPEIGEEIYIPQHPGGRPKELGFEDSNQADGKCKVKGYSGGCSPEDMRYTCDTEGGSSGSPVLSRVTNKVVALHHCGGGCAGNLGAPIYKFYNLLNIGSPAPTVSPKPTPRPTTPRPTKSPTMKPTVPSSSFGPTPSSYGTGEPTPTNGGGSPTKSPTASPTKSEKCEDAKSKKACKKLKHCAFQKKKVPGPCEPKGNKYKHECSDYDNSADCSDDDNHGGLCKFEDGSCIHVCTGLEFKQCKKFKLGGNKVCNAKKINNPCGKGCKPLDCGDN